MIARTTVTGILTLSVVLRVVYLIAKVARNNGHSANPSDSSAPAASSAGAWNSVA